MRSSACWRFGRFLQTAVIGFVVSIVTASAPGSDDAPISVDVRPSSQSYQVVSLSVSGRHFVDRVGRIVLLRGINLPGDAKVPPFVPGIGPEDLDRVADLGFNVIRLLFLWEAFEPFPGIYDEAYLNSVMAVAAEAHQRGILTIIDFHQDGFSRHCSAGCGDGFPAWAVSPRGRRSIPHNGPQCSDWPLRMALDPTTHRSYKDFFNDRFGVRTRYLMMLSKVASAFESVPGVIGYDPINEPWGDERKELLPLYRDAAATIRAVHPSAIIFFEGHITTNSGIQTRLPRPDSGPVAYAPHYYNPTTIVLHHWHGLTATMDNAFRHMRATSAAWHAPLFVGEFGMDARVSGVGEYIDEVYDRLDASLASGAHWNLTPGWDPVLKDGWNGEDFTILDPLGRLRSNYRPRPYPRATAGQPIRFFFRRGSTWGRRDLLEFDWLHDPSRGETEIFLPRSVFSAGSVIETRAVETTSIVSVQFDAPGQRLRITADRPTPLSLRIWSR